MDKLFGDLKNFFKTRKCVVDNFVFRLHYRFTLVLLIAFSIAVTGRQFLGDPIDCISKDDIPEALLKTFCWISTTFSIKSAWKKEIGKEIPYPGIDKYTEGEERVYHAYYQWVCFVLFLQAMLFYIPRYLWKNAEAHKIQNLVMDLNSPVVQACRKDETKLLVEYLKDSAGHHVFYSSFFIFCEILNFVNVVGQIYLMDTFLGGEFTSYGTEVLSFTEWDYTLRYDPMIKVFPRMSKCTFYRYGSSGDVQKHDAMCLIPINIMNEKIYIFLWFWFVILSILSGLEVLYRMAILLVKPFRYLVLRSMCQRIDPKALKIVLRRCDRFDWMVLIFLCQNMRSENFKHVIHELAKAFEKES